MSKQSFELMEVLNVHSKKKTHYLIKDGSTRRISEIAYNRHKYHAERIDCLRTECTETHVRQYCTVR